MESAENLPENDPPMPFRIFPFTSRLQAAVLVVLLALALYIPSLENEYALDDGLVIHQNSFVLKGIRGIGDIMTTDVFHSFYKRMHAHDMLFGGRFRPLPSLTYAIEQEIIGTYRTGFYQYSEDHDRSGKLDDVPTPVAGLPYREINYEFNDYVDIDKSGNAQLNECFNCWDTNKNFYNEVEEDLNADGVFNEVDCQVKGAGLRHFVNMILYAACCLMVFLLLSGHWLEQKPDAALLATLIFTLHPVHSEVVANVRGRDDLLSLTFILATLYFAAGYMKEKRRGQLALSALCFALALLCKEYAALLIILLPVSLYVLYRERLSAYETLLTTGAGIGYALVITFIEFHPIHYYFNGWIYLAMGLLFPGIMLVMFWKFLRRGSAAGLFVALNCVFLAYLSLRFYSVGFPHGAVDTELLNNPFLLATGEEEFSTKVVVLSKYLGLLFFPVTLVSDYSYNSIPYSNFADIAFWLSLALHLALTVLAVWLCIRRSLAGLALIWYLVFIFATSNLFFLTGTMMVESYLFHPSLGASVCIALALLFIPEKIFKSSPSARRALIFSVLLIAGIFSFVQCWERSRDWKNDVTLFLKDVENAPNSVLVLGNAGARWVDLSDTREITGMSTENDTRPYNDYNGTLAISEEEIAAGAYSSRREAALYKAIGYLQKAVDLHPRYVNGYLNLGLAYYKLENDVECIKNWKFAEHLYPGNPYLNNYYSVYSSQLNEKADTALKANNYAKAAKYYSLLCLLQPKNPNTWYNLGIARYMSGRSEQALIDLAKANELSPGDSIIRKAITFVSGDK